MAIITISRGSYSKGKEVAENVASRLQYECVSRDVLLDASDRFRIPEIKLKKAIHDAPSILDRFSHGKQDYVAYIQSALAQRARKDNVVYHGLAGHVLLKGVDHVLKVRIIADLADRVANEVQREGNTEEEARAQILKDDEERRKWTQSLYGVDPWDPSLYDLLVHIHRLTVGDAVDFICAAAGLQQFKTTPESQRKMDDLAIACSVKAVLTEQFPDVAVGCDYGNVLIYTKGSDRHVERIEAYARSRLGQVHEINNLEVHVGDAVPPNAV